jgi:hypothetical protein
MQLLGRVSYKVRNYMKPRKGNKEMIMDFPLPVVESEKGFEFRELVRV